MGNLSYLLRAPGTQAPQYLPPDSGPNQSPTELVSELQALLSLFDWLRSQLSSQPCILLTPASYTGLPVLLGAVARHRLEDQFYSLFTAFTDLQSVVLQFQVKAFKLYVCMKINRDFKLTFCSQIGTCTTLASPHWACFQREPDSLCLLTSRVMRRQNSPSSASKQLSTCNRELWVFKKS